MCFYCYFASILLDFIIIFTGNNFWLQIQCIRKSTHLSIFANDWQYNHRNFNGIFPPFLFLLLCGISSGLTVIIDKGCTFNYCSICDYILWEYFRTPYERIGNWFSIWSSLLKCFDLFLLYCWDCTAKTDTSEFRPNTLSYFNKTIPKL